MTHLKKSLAMLLALIMMFSSMSIAANAWTPSEDPDDITFTVKFFRESPIGSGNWILTEKAAPGETVKARFYIKTGYATHGGETCLVYDKEFFSGVGLQNNLPMDVSVNPNYAGPDDDLYGAGEYELEGVAGWKNADSFSEWASKYDWTYMLGLVGADYFKTYDLMTNSIVFENTKLNSRLDDSDWMYQFDFVVNDNAKTTTIDSTGEISVPPFYNSIDRDGDFPINIMKGKEGENRTSPAYNKSMWLWEPDFTSNPGTLSTTSEIIFDMGLVDEDGAWKEDTYITQKGIISKEAKFPENPTHPDGKSFKYWSTEKPDSGAEQTEVSVISYDYDAVTLYAVWGEPEDVEYTLKKFYMNADGTYPEDVEGTTEYAKPNDKVSAPASTDERFTLDETKSDSDVVIKSDNSSVVNAYYERNKYKVVYHYEDMSGDATDEYYARFGAELPAFGANESGEPQKTGYTFVGWTTTEGGTESETLPLVMPAQEIHFYAIYVPGETYDFEFIFDAMEGTFSDGDKIKRYAYQYLEDTEEPEEPTALGKRFVGWDNDIPEKADGDMRFEAIYEDVEYTVTFKADQDEDGTYETTVSELKFTYGEKLYPEYAPENYPADVWTFEDGTPVEFINDEEKAFAITEDVVLYTVGADEYPANFYWSEEDLINGAEPYDTVYVKFDTEIPAPADPQKPGYDFIQWELDLDGQIMDSTEGKDFYAIFELKDITVTYDPDGGECGTDSETVKYGESVTLPEASMEGYEFLGWVTPDGTNVGKAGESYEVPTDNVTLKADWEKIIKDVEYQIYISYPNPANPEETIEKAVITDSALPETTVGVIKEGETATTDKAHTYEEILENVTVDGIEPDYDNRPDPITVTENGGKLVVSFKLTEYTVTFNPNGGKFGTSDESVTVKGTWGQSVEKPADPTMEGYSFTGWDKTVPETFTENVEINATWAIQKHNAIFIVVDENGNEVDRITVEYEYGKEISAPEYTPEEGYEFDGWDVPAGTKMGEKDVTFEAPRAELYDVTYYSEDGETVLEEFADAGRAGAALPEIDDPVKEGYEFTGWVDKDGNSVTEIPAGDIDLYATFKALGFTITYKDNGETVHTANYNTDDPIEEYTLADETGKKFKGWTPALPDTMPAENLTVEAVWETNKHEFTLDANGGVFENGESEFSETFDYDTDLSDKLPENPTRDGYEFAGWEDADGNVSMDLPEKMPDNEVSLKATWTVATHKAEYYYAVDGELYETLTVEEGKPVVHPADPTVEGLTFVEWVDKDGNPIPDDLVMGKEDIKIYAKFDVNTYKVTYIVDGEVYEEYDVLYQAEVPVPEDPADSPERVFAGWNPAPVAVMPAHDLTYTATWADPEPDKYTATFLRADGKTHSKQVLAEGEAIEIPEAPQKFGYVFVGWEPEVPETMPAQDMVFEPQYEVDKTFVTIVVGGTVIAGGAIAASIANAAIITGVSIIGGVIVLVGVAELVKHTHTVTYIVDGEVYKTYKLVEGMNIPVPADPVKDGFTFEGWNPEVPEKMGKEDLTFEATFAEKSDDDSADIDVEIPETGSVAGGLAAFAAISGAAAAAYVITSRKKED